MIATASAVAFIVFSCKGKLSEAERLNLAETPVQTVDSMFVVQTRNGGIQMRVEADVMERYENDTCSYELFPKGLQRVADVMPLGVGIDLMKAASIGADMKGSLPNIIILAVIAAVCSTVAVKTFRWE